MKQIKSELEKLLADRINPIGQDNSPSEIADEIIQLLKVQIHDFERRVKFVKPSIQDIEHYLINHDSANQKTLSEINEIASEFYKHYESVGWVVGKIKKPMVNWRMSVDGWVKRNQEWNKGKTAKVDESIQAYIGVQKLKSSNNE